MVQITFKDGRIDWLCSHHCEVGYWDMVKGMGAEIKHCDSPADESINPCFACEIEKKKEKRNNEPMNQDTPLIGKELADHWEDVITNGSERME